MIEWIPNEKDTMPAVGETYVIYSYAKSTYIGTYKHDIKAEQSYWLLEDGRTLPASKAAYYAVINEPDLEALFTWFSPSDPPPDIKGV